MGDTYPANTNKYRASSLRIFRKKRETVPPSQQTAHYQIQEKFLQSLASIGFAPDTADTTKSFSERDGEAAPKGCRECVIVADKSLVRSGSERSEAPPIAAKPLLIFRLTAEQADHLEFAALCQVEALEQSHEFNDSEVQEAIQSLNKSMRILAKRELT